MLSKEDLIEEKIRLAAILDHAKLELDAVQLLINIHEKYPDLPSFKKMVPFEKTKKIKLCRFCEKELSNTRVQYHDDCRIEKERARSRRRHHECMAERPEYKRAINRKVESNPKRKAYKKKWAQDHRDIVNARGRRYSAANREKCRAAAKRWYYNKKAKEKTSQKLAIKNILNRSTFIRKKPVSNRLKLIGTAYKPPTDELSKPILSRDMNIMTANKFINLPPEKIASMDFRKLLIMGYAKPPEIS